VELLQTIGDVERIFVQPEVGSSELAARLGGFDAIVASTSPRYDEQFFGLNASVKVLARHGIGVDNIDIKAATEHGVVITVVPRHVEREAVAEHTIALMLSSLRRITGAHTAVKEGRWHERSSFVGFELRGKNVLVCGLGNVGSRVADILKNGFQAEVLVYDPYIDRNTTEQGGFRYVPKLEDGLKAADIITLHVPLTAETRHLIDHKALAIVKRGVIIVNTSRGEIVDAHALVKALDDGIAGAVAMDVVEGGSIGADDPLLKFENVIITPHIAAYTSEGLKGMDLTVAKDVISVLNHERPLGLLNEEVLASPNLRTRIPRNPK